MQTGQAGQGRTGDGRQGAGQGRAGPEWSGQLSGQDRTGQKTDNIECRRGQEDRVREERDQKTER